jgi:hypothetical protein
VRSWARRAAAAAGTDERLRDPESLLHSLRHRSTVAAAPPATDQLEKVTALLLTAVRARQSLMQLEQLVGGHPAGKRNSSARYPVQREPREPGARAANLRAPRRRPNETARDLDERRFPGTVRPSKPTNSLADLEIDSPSASIAP